MRCLRRSAPLLAAAAAWLGSAALAGPASADTYSCTTADQTATAPSGAQGVHVDIIGAAGGNSADASGGNGAEVQATILVTPGEQFTVVVGCQGTLTAGGYGGGGPFGQSNTGSSADNGAGGGGATAILPAGDDNFADADAVAGGGGGGAGGQYTGGGAGGNADSDGIGGGADYTSTGGFFPGGFGGQSGDSGGGAGTTYGQPQGTYIDYTGYNYGYPGSNGTNGSAGPGGAGGTSNGHDHPRALRTLGRAWCRIVWRCWQNHTPYDPARHHALQQHIAVTVPGPSGPRPDLTATERMAGAAVTPKAARTAKREALDSQPTTAIQTGG